MWHVTLLHTTKRMRRYEIMNRTLLYNYWQHVEDKHKASTIHHIHVLHVIMNIRVFQILAACNTKIQQLLLNFQ